MNSFHTSLEGQLGVEIKQLNPIDNGYNSRVFRLQTTIGDLILRLQPIETNRFSIEQNVLGKLAMTDSNVLPSIIQTGQIVYGGAEHAFSLAEALPGVNLDNFIQNPSITEESKIRAIKELGRELRKIHLVQAEGYGLLTHDLKGVSTDISSWAEAIQYRFSTATAGLKKETIGIFSQLAESIDPPSMTVTNPVYTHGDFVPRNILVEEETGKITGIIDFEHAKSHLPELDLAYWHFYWQGPEATDALLDGYGNDIDRSILDSLAVLRGLDATAYWLEKHNIAKGHVAAKRVLQLTNKTK